MQKHKKTTARSRGHVRAWIAMFSGFGRKHTSVSAFPTYLSVESLPVTYSWVLAPFRVRLLAVKPMYRYSITISISPPPPDFNRKMSFSFILTSRLILCTMVEIEYKGCDEEERFSMLTESRRWVQGGSGEKQGSMASEPGVRACCGRGRAAPRRLRKCHRVV